MRFGGINYFLNILYDDRMSVYRNSTILNEDGTTEYTRSETPVYDNIKCRISFNNKRDNVSADAAHMTQKDIGVNPLDLVPVIFCDTQYVLKAGDYVVVNRLDDDGVVRDTVQGYISKPNWYTSHQEMQLAVREVG